MSVLNHSDAHNFGLGGVSPPAAIGTIKEEDGAQGSSPRLSKELVMSVMAAVNKALGIDFQQADLAEIFATDDLGNPVVNEVQETALPRPAANGTKPRRPSRGEGTKGGGLNHYRLICEACGHIVIAVVTAVLRAVDEAHAESLAKGDVTVKPVAPVRKKRGGILGFKELATRAKLSPWHFHRVFRHVTGVTPKAYGEALWDHLMRRYGFEIDDVPESQGVYSSISSDSPTEVGSNNSSPSASILQAPGQPGGNGSAATAAASGGRVGRLATTHFNAQPTMIPLENGGSAMAPGVAGRVRKSSRAAQQRQSRSRSRNRSQTQQQVLSSLAHLQIPGAAARSPSPAAPMLSHNSSSSISPNIMGVPLDGSAISPDADAGVLGTSLPQSMGPQALQQPLQQQPHRVPHHQPHPQRQQHHQQPQPPLISPVNAGVNQQQLGLESVFPSLDAGLVDQSYDTLGLDDPEFGSEWVGTENEYLPKAFDDGPASYSGDLPDLNSLSLQQQMQPNKYLANRQPKDQLWDTTGMLSDPLAQQPLAGHSSHPSVDNSQMLFNGLGADSTQPPLIPGATDEELNNLPSPFYMSDDKDKLDFENDYFSATGTIAPGALNSTFVENDLTTAPLDDIIQNPVSF